LSVDIDLTYLPLDSRATALKNIEEGLKRIKIDLEQNINGLKVHTVPLHEKSDVKLNCQRQNAQIKIEVNTITRGHIFPTELMQVVDRVQDKFGKFIAINMVSMAELYGGKICAAIDRQHPRDIFDVKLLLKNEGFTDDIWIGFKAALISHYKPIAELLFPVLKDQKSAFENQFAGMTTIPFSYDDYESTRSLLIKIIQQRLTKIDSQFFLSFERGIPDWELFPIPNLKDLPAVKWKLINICELKKVNVKKHEQLIGKLKVLLQENE